MADEELGKGRRRARGRPRERERERRFCLDHFFILDRAIGSGMTGGGERLAFL